MRSRRELCWRVVPVSRVAEHCRQSILAELLSAVEGSSLVADPDSPQAVNVRELRRGYDREKKIPRRLVEEMARVTAHASRIWADARKDNDFKSFAPWLDKVFALSREEALSIMADEVRKGWWDGRLLDEFLGVLATLPENDERIRRRL